ncbi:trifolitoxin immunity protein [Nocardiopsis alba]|uniref:trifolitoxin immunity protein n=1 Tax=Nocardiopsis alba TaxID=53437 RepID=UPI003672CE1B
MSEIPLEGGFVTRVVRVGDTVRRVPAERSGFVHELLEHLRERSWPGAPRFLGLDEQGREVLSFLPGHVAWRPEDAIAVRTLDALRGVARLVRELHDLTAGTPLAGASEVVCHNDLAHVCWQYLDLGPGWTDAVAAGETLREIADAYGPGAYEDPADLVDTVLWWQERCRRGIEEAARRGHPAMIHLRETGVVREIEEVHAWTLQHREALLRGLRR